MWVRLNLPILLLRVGLLTLIKIDSLIYLDIWKLVFNESSSVPEKINFYKCYNRMCNLHKFILENYGIGSLRLLRDWKKFHLRQCDFKNHRIFTLRCIHSELVPVSIRLKSTLKSERAKKILRTAEKQLLQTRLKPCQ